MSYTDKLRAKAQKEKQVKNLIKEIQRHPDFAEFRRRWEVDATEKAFDAFALITCDYLHRIFRCKKNGLRRFCDWAIKQLGYTFEDPLYFKLMNSELKDETGFDVIEYLKDNISKAEEK